MKEKINHGIYTRKQARQDAQKNVLVRTVGYDPDLEVESYKYRIQTNDLFLLCSDGLSGKVSDEDIIRIVNEQLNDPTNGTTEKLESAAQKLIDLANTNGGQDNISVILVLVKNN